jgi:hypothetical protein
VRGLLHFSICIFQLLFFNPGTGPAEGPLDYIRRFQEELEQYRLSVLASPTLPARRARPAERHQGKEGMPFILAGLQTGDG